MGEGLHYVYMGNLPGKGGENTICPGCKKVVIKRLGYTVLENHLDKEGKCEFCGYKIPGIWS